MQFRTFARKEGEKGPPHAPSKLIFPKFSESQEAFQLSWTLLVANSRILNSPQLPESARTEVMRKASGSLRAGVISVALVFSPSLLPHDFRDSRNEMSLLDLGETKHVGLIMSTGPGKRTESRRAGYQTVGIVGWSVNLIWLSNVAFVMKHFSSSTSCWSIIFFSFRKKILKCYLFLLQKKF